MINKRKRSTKQSRSPSSDIMAFGYSSKIYSDKLMAQKIDDGAFLIPWQSNTDYNHWKFDRYDIRHLLDEMNEFDTNQTPKQQDDNWRDPIDLECDQERYADLDSDEELLFDMSDAEDREAHVAEKRRRRSKVVSTGHLYHYDYDSTSPPPDTPLTIADRSADVQQIAQQFNIPTTSTMVVPTNSRNSDDNTNSDNEGSPGLAFIVETAQAIVERTQTGSQPVNVCEIQFQVRHSQDRRYNFLNKQHLYYPFYQHVRKYLESKHQPLPSSSSSSSSSSTISLQRTTMTKGAGIKGKGGLVDYGSDDSSSDDECEDDKQQQQQQQHQRQNGDQVTQEIPSDVMQTIDKMAASVAKVGLELEHKIRHLRSQDPRFAFLQPHHRYHFYYQKQLGLKSQQRP